MSLAQQHSSSVTEYATKHAKAFARPNLRLVSPLRPDRASRGVFLVVVTSALAVGLLAMLLINTALAQGAFTVSDLKSQQAALLEQEAMLREEVSALAAPGALEQAARDMGMVPSLAPAFLNLADGTILGKPKSVPVSKYAPLPRVATPADATAAEGIDSGLADRPAPLPADYDPAAADTGVPVTKSGKAKADKAGEDALWVEVPVAPEITGDAALSLEPVTGR